MASEPLPYVSIVVPTFRRPDALGAAARAIAALDYDSDRYELIVVDNDGRGDTAEIVGEAVGSHVRFTVETQRQGGAAASRNLGARRAEGEVLLFLDDDMIVAADHLRRHVQTLGSAARVLVNGVWEFTPQVIEQLSASAFGRFRLDLERQFKAEATGSQRPDGKVEVAMVGSGDLSLARETFLELGGFDEDFPVAGAEDQDLSIRARQAGCRLLRDPEIVSLHNDNRIDRLSYCAREERSASTMPLLARKYPRELASLPYVTANRPLRRGDPPALALKKLAKAVLASGWVLPTLHRLTALAERCRAPEAVLRRLYTILMGLHLFRGFRSTYQS